MPVNYSGLHKRTWMHRLLPLLVYFKDVTNLHEYNFHFRNITVQNGSFLYLNQICSFDWKAKLLLFYCDYTLSLMYLWTVYLAFTNIKILNKSKFYTLDL